MLLCTWIFFLLEKSFWVDMQLLRKGKQGAALQCILEQIHAVVFIYTPTHLFYICTHIFYTQTHTHTHKNTFSQMGWCVQHCKIDLPSSLTGCWKWSWLNMTQTLSLIVQFISECTAGSLIICKTSRNAWLASWGCLYWAIINTLFSAVCI